MLRPEIEFSQFAIPMVLSPGEPKYLLNIQKDDPLSSLREVARKGKYLALYRYGDHELMGCPNPFPYQHDGLNITWWILPHQYYPGMKGKDVWEPMLQDSAFMTGFSTFIQQRSEANYAFLHIADSLPVQPLPPWIDPHVIQSIDTPHLHVIPKESESPPASDRYLTDRLTLSRFLNIGGEETILRFHRQVHQCLGAQGQLMEFQQHLTTLSGPKTVTRTMYGFADITTAIRASRNLQQNISRSDWFDWAYVLHQRHPGVLQSPCPNMAVFFPPIREIQGSGNIIRAWVVPFTTMCPMQHFQQQPFFPQRDSNQKK